MLLPKQWAALSLHQISNLAPIERVQFQTFNRAGIKVYVSREDLLDHLVGGNKVYKLYGYLNDYFSKKLDIPIATFGGAFSNHILALASAGNSHNIPTVGIIRGERTDKLSPTLIDAQTLGMKLHFVSRSEYRRRNDVAYLEEVEASIGPAYWVPEGGAGQLGQAGCQALAAGLLERFGGIPTAIFHACGTGSSLKGILEGLMGIDVDDIYIYGVSVLKGMEVEYDALLLDKNLKSSDSMHCRVLHDYHWGGYAKFPRELALFMQDFEDQSGIPLDPVYTSKVMWAVKELAEKQQFSPGAEILVVHSGGLQGRRGFGLPWN